MIILPAIDLYNGKAVRLYKGNYSEMTVYNDNPLSVAEDFEKSGAKQIRQFQERLMKLGLSVTVRRELGSDINAACGQLRKAVLEEEKREQNKLAEVKQK